MLDLHELLKVETEKPSKLILVTIEYYLQLLVQHLLSLDKGLFEWDQALAIFNQCGSIILLLVDVLRHLDKQILLLSYALCAFGIDLDDFSNSLQKLLLLPKELILLLLVFRLRRVDCFPIVHKQFHDVLLRVVSDKVP